MCLRLMKKFKYLRRHARVVHDVPPSGELSFVRAAKAFRKKRPEFEKAMGFAPPPPKQGPPTPARYEYEMMGATSDSESECSDSDDGGPRRRRVSRGELDRSGFLSGLDGRCPQSRQFERLLVDVTGVSRATAAKKAGVLHRYLQYTRDHEPNLTDLERMTTYHVAVSAIQEYRKHFSPRSVVILADALRNCVVMMEYCKPLQVAFSVNGDQHRGALAAAAVMWTQQRKAANKAASIRQRGCMSRQPLESWTHLIPVEPMVDYLREYGPAVAAAAETAAQTAAEDEAAPPLVVLCDVDPAAPRPAPVPDFPDSAHDRAVRKRAYDQARSVAALYLVMSGVRLCVALALTRKDLRRATAWGDVSIVSVARHKTSRHHGAAHVVLRPHALQALHDLASATEAFFGPDEAAERNLFGLTEPHGRAAAVMFSDFNGFVRLRGYDVHFGRLSFNKARKGCESFAHLLGTAGEAAGSAAAQRTICDFLLHSTKVRNLYYRKTSFSALVTQWTTFNNLLAVMYVLESARAGRLQLQVHRGESNYVFSHDKLFFFTVPIIFISALPYSINPYPLCIIDSLFLYRPSNLFNPYAYNVFPFLLVGTVIFNSSAFN